MVPLRRWILVVTEVVAACAAAVLYGDSGPTSIAIAPPPHEDTSSHITLSTDLDDYRWPTDAGRIVTSTFGEFRQTHFHAGIDISSGDATGYRVFASRSGYVSRIRVSPVGYGKMLFVRHRDGFTTTYAHLARFARPIELRAESEQRRLQRYPVDIICDSTDFPVEKGEVIAYTGETGTGSPHLHFEIRDCNMNPVNPFLAPHLRIHDTLPPTIRKIAVRPIEMSSTVDGRREPSVYRAVPAGKERYIIPHTILTSGPVGIAVSARDRVNGSRFHNGVYTHTLTIDGKTVFSVRMLRTPADETQEIGLYYDWDLLDDGEGRFEKLYMDSPNTLGFYTPPGPWSGILDDIRMNPGRHSFTITSKDFNGNSSLVSGTIVICRAPAFEASRSGDDIHIRFFEPKDVHRVLITSLAGSSTGQPRLWTAESGGPPSTLVLPLVRPTPPAVSISVQNRWDVWSPPVIMTQNTPFAKPADLSLNCIPEESGIFVRLSSQGIIGGHPAVSVQEGGSHATILVTAENPNTCSGWYLPTAFQGKRTIEADAMVDGRQVHASASCTIFPILPTQSDSIVLLGGKVSVRYDTSSVFAPLPFWVEARQGPEGPVFALHPEDVVLNRGLIVTLHAPQLLPHTALYFRSRRRWQLIGGWDHRMNSGRLSRRTGEVALLTDDNPPVIRRLRIVRGTQRKPRITFKYSDDRSGVEYNEVKMYIDDRAVIPQIDGEHRRVNYQPSDPLDRGSHQLTIRLMDKMGNSTKAERRFVLR